MSHFQDFSSLLQLGVGVGIGLSLFRAPVDVRTAKISKTLDGELRALRLSSGEFARRKRRDLIDLRVEFASVLQKLEKVQSPCMVLAIVGAAANLIALVLSSLHAQADVSVWGEIALVFVSVLYFLFLVGFLEIAARLNLSGIQNALIGIQLRKST